MTTYADFLNTCKTAFKREPTVEEMLQVFPQGPNQGASGLWLLAESEDTSDVTAFWEAFKQINSRPLAGWETGPTADQRDRFKHTLLSRAPQKDNLSALFFLLKRHPSVGIEIFNQFKEDIPISDLLSVPNILEQLKKSENFSLMIYILKNCPSERKNLLAFLKGKNQFIEMIDQDVFNCLDDESRAWLWDQRNTLPLPVIELMLWRALTKDFSFKDIAVQSILCLLKERQLLSQVKKFHILGVALAQCSSLDFLELDDLFIKFSENESIFKMLLENKQFFPQVLQKFASSISSHDPEIKNMLGDFLMKHRGIIHLDSTKGTEMPWWESLNLDLNIPDLIAQRNELFEGLERLTPEHTTEQTPPLFELALKAYNAGYLNAYLDLGTSLHSINSSEAALAFEKHENTLTTPKKGLRK